MSVLSRQRKLVCDLIPMGFAGCLQEVIDLKGLSDNMIGKWRRFLGGFGTQRIWAGGT